jgi:hypothetical protein
LKHTYYKDSIFTTDNMITKQKEWNKWWSNSWDEGENGHYKKVIQGKESSLWEFI